MKNHSSPVTIRQLAETLGVSRTTVSYAFSPNWQALRVSPQTREKVLSLANLLGYSPNKLAAGLRTGKSHTIGIMVPFFLGGGEHDLLSGVENALGDQYTTLIGSSRHSAKRELQILQSFEERMVDGLLITPSHHQGTCKALQIIQKRGIPIVQVERYFPKLKTSIVEPDHQQLSQTCTEHLIQLGHRRIAFIGSPFIHTGNLARLEGYRKAMKKAGLSELCYTPDKHPTSIEQASSNYYINQTLRALHEFPRPTALFCNEFAPAYQAAQQSELRCPEKLSITSISLADEKDHFLRSMWQIQPTLAVWSAEELGFKAATLLAEQIRDSKSPRQHIKLSGQLQMGNSTRPPDKDSS